MICLRQIPFDVRVERRLFEGILRRLFENVVGAGVAEKISDQHPARTVHESVDGQRVFALVFHFVYRARHTTWAKIVGVEPKRLDRVPELRFSLRVHQFEDLVCLCFGIICIWFHERISFG